MQDERHAAARPAAPRSARATDARASGRRAASAATQTAPRPSAVRVLDLGQRPRRIVERDDGDADQPLVAVAEGRHGAVVGAARWRSARPARASKIGRAQNDEKITCALKPSRSSAWPAPRR